MLACKHVKHKIMLARVLAVEYSTREGRGFGSPQKPEAGTALWAIPASLPAPEEAGEISTFRDYPRLTGMSSNRYEDLRLYRWFQPVPRMR